MAGSTSRVPRLLQVGTDFSGLDSAWVALQRLKLPAKLMFCSDSDKFCQKFIKTKHKPLKFFDDIEERQPEAEDYCDVYVSTPPCQSFSSAGKRKGVKDKRGKVIKHTVKYIQRKRPRCAIVENVKGMTFKKFRPVLNGVVKALRSLNYYVYLKVLNAVDFQIPQRRKRLFIVAIRKDSLRRKFAWPEPTGAKTLQSILDPWKDTDHCGRLPKLECSRDIAKKTYAKIYSKGINPVTTLCAVDVSCSEKYMTFGVDVSPTLLRSRASTGGYWLTTRGRKMTLTEMAKVCGFLPAELSGVGIRRRQLAAMLGNTVPVPLIGEVMVSVLVAAGLLSARKSVPIA